MKGIPPAITRIIQRFRIIYDGERGAIETEALSNGAVVDNVQANPPTDLPINDNQKRRTIELW